MKIFLTSADAFYPFESPPGLVGNRPITFSMKKLAYVAGLFALTCAPLLAALYENLEVGMDKDQVLKTLRQSKQLEGPPTDALLSRTGLNGVFKTKQSIGGQTFSLNFDYDPSGGLRAVVFYSRSKCRGSEYETKLKSAYKALLVGLTEKFGEPANMPEWVAKESLQEGRIQYMHMWRVSPGVFLMSGLGNMGAMEGYFPLFRFSGPSGMPPKSKRDREELKREWAAIPEFPGLKEAELHISDAVRAMGTKKYEDAFECFQQAAELGSPRGYWGMAFLSELGKYGVKRDEKKADEMNRKAAAAGYAASASKFGATWPDAARALGLSATAAREQLHMRQRAAAEGYASEQYNMGIMYHTGFGMPKDPAKAREWFQKAADQDDVQAKSILKKLQ